MRKIFWQRTWLKTTKNYDKGFDKTTKYWINDKDYGDGDVKIRNHCNINGKETLHIETVISRLN